MGLPWGVIHSEGRGWGCRVGGYIVRAGVGVAVGGIHSEGRGWGCRVCVGGYIVRAGVGVAVCVCVWDT